MHGARRFSERIEQETWLDSIGDGLRSAIAGTYSSLGEPGPQIKRMLHGTWLGHPLHAVLIGGPLAEGSLKDGSIVCPWHASRFAIEDGRVLDGPAVHPQPSLETRVHDGQIEVRAATQ